MSCVTPKKVRTSIIRAGIGQALRSSERLVGRGQYLRGHEFVEARAATADMALATFEGAGHTRQRVLHDPDIPSVLDYAASLPWSFKSANRPRSPDTRIRGAKQGNSFASGSGGQMRDRCVGSDIDACFRK